MSEHLRNALEQIAQADAWTIEKHDGPRVADWMRDVAQAALGRDRGSKPGRAETPKSGSVEDESPGAEGNRP